MVGRRRWSAPAVQKVRDILLGPDREAAYDYIRKERVAAVKAGVEALQLVEKAERQAFRKNPELACHGVTDRPLHGHGIHPATAVR